MTLSDSPSESRRSAEALPTFSTPQFSPVAPVPLPMSMTVHPWGEPVLVHAGYRDDRGGHQASTRSRPRHLQGRRRRRRRPRRSSAAPPAGAPGAAPAAEPAAAVTEPGEDKAAAATAEEKPSRASLRRSGPSATGAVARLASRGVAVRAARRGLGGGRATATSSGQGFKAKSGTKARRQVPRRSAGDVGTQEERR